mmetsp:Transcript_46912/g.99663  ORF Transcript_46912/g.99663 Transcript_46912/m.99663 type:complete len:133 (-) Transcript_46912:243-641(-)
MSRRRVEEGPAVEAVEEDHAGVEAADPPRPIAVAGTVAGGMRAVGMVEEVGGMMEEEVGGTRTVGMEVVEVGDTRAVGKEEVEGIAVVVMEGAEMVVTAVARLPLTAVGPKIGASYLHMPPCKGEVMGWYLF